MDRNLMVVRRFDIRFFAVLFAPIIVVFAFASDVKAQAVSVPGTSDIFAAGQSSVPNLTNGGGTLPVSVSVSAGASLTISASGEINTQGGNSSNNYFPDGNTVAFTINSPITGISDFNGPGGPLLGVFLSGSLPSSSPAAFNFTSGGIGTSFASLSPTLGQVFFIGDGLTGTGTGAQQAFNVPTGATTLYLGIADALNNPGPAGYYSDNSGAYSVTVVPEPATLGALSVAGLGLQMRRRRKSQ